MLKTTKKLLNPVSRFFGSGAEALDIRDVPDHQNGIAENDSHRALPPEGEPPRSTEVPHEDRGIPLTALSDDADDDVEERDHAPGHETRETDYLLLEGQGREESNEAKDESHVTRSARRAHEAADRLAAPEA